MSHGNIAVVIYLNPLTPTRGNLINITLSNARQFYLSMVGGGEGEGAGLGVNGLRNKLREHFRTSDQKTYKQVNRKE